MKANEGLVDRGLRIVLGLLAIAAAFVWLDASGGAILGIVVGVIGAILFITGLVGFCPAYAACGIKTRPQIKPD